MKKNYIDSEKLKAEIKRYKNKADERLKIKGKTFSEEQKDLALQNLCGNLLHFIDSLQQEQSDFPTTNEEIDMTREEAIKRIKSRYDKWALDDKDLEAIQYIFPGLKEDENERIKEAIEGTIRVYGKTQGGWIGGYDMDTLVIHLRKAFGALEKQEKADAFGTKYEGEKLRNIVIAELGKYNGSNFFKAPWAIDSTGLQYPLYFANLGAKWQKEQKPKIYIPKFRNGDTIKLKGSSLTLTITNIEDGKYYGKGWSLDIIGADKSYEKETGQESTEWSEEDKVMLNNIICGVHMKSIKPLDEMDDRSKYEKYEDFLKSLPTRFSLHPKVGWSEEDKRKLNRIYEILGYAADDKGFLTSKRIIGDNEAIELQDFLKSLREIH